MDQRGLFALDVRRCDPDEPDSLFDPTTNAEWTHALFAHYARSWDWHPVWTATSGRLVRSTLLALDEDRGWMDRAGVFFARTRHLRRPADAWSTVQRVALGGAVQSPTESELPWPPITASQTSDRPALS